MTRLDRHVTIVRNRMPVGFLLRYLSGWLIASSAIVLAGILADRLFDA